VTSLLSGLESKIENKLSSLEHVRCLKPMFFKIKFLIYFLNVKFILCSTRSLFVQRKELWLTSSQVTRSSVRKGICCFKRRAVHALLFGLRAFLLFLCLKFWAFAFALSRSRALVFRARISALPAFFTLVLYIYKPGHDRQNRRDKMGHTERDRQSSSGRT
jgi:hypothetical protein